MPKDKTENHKKIIASAQKEFMTYGFKDASMRRIAADAKMSASGLYKHFPSKEEMFAALVAPAYDGLIEMYRQSADETRRILDTADFSHIWEGSHETVWIMEYMSISMLSAWPSAKQKEHDTKTSCMISPSWEKKER